MCTGGDGPEMSEADLRNAMLDFNDLFAEAREEIEAAEEAMETVYFNEEFEIAVEAVDEALACYESVLARLRASPPVAVEGPADAAAATQSGEQRAEAVHRANGLKVEQLKGELEMLRQKALED